MKYLFRHWDHVRHILRSPGNVLWLFDFDGTLAPIEQHPDRVLFPKPIRTLLHEVARRYPRRVGILSGRSLQQVRRKIGVSGLLYAGAHGFEIQGPDFHWRHALTPRRKRQFEEWIRSWRVPLESIPGIWIENKRWTVCVHYRQARTRDQARVRSFLYKLSNQARRLGFKLVDGLKDLEVFCDARWDKGQAVRWLMQHYRGKNVFYVGDDTTDEAVFRVLGRSGIGVRIGQRSSSSATYFLKKQSETRTLLERILTL